MSLRGLWLLAFSLPLASCLFDFSDDGWKEYYTPELFLDHASVHRYVTVHSTEIDRPDGVLDYKLAVKDAILAAAPFEGVSEASEKSARFLSYKILISHATTGPNYSNMYVYDNGLLQIDFKASLGSLHTFYYTFDETKSKELNTFAENRIRQIVKEEAEDLKEAKEKGSITNFVKTMESAAMIPIRCWKDNRLYEGRDDGSVLALLKETAFTLETSTDSFPTTLAYNYGTSTLAPSVKDWYFDLSTERNRVRVVYHYLNRYGVSDSLALIYSLDARQGEAIFNAALSATAK